MQSPLCAAFAISDRFLSHLPDQTAYPAKDCRVTWARGRTRRQGDGRKPPGQSEQKLGNYRQNTALSLG
jgi:hypothetical protein